jgi:WD40 repeat protein
LATGDADGSVRLWDPVAGREVGPPITGHTREVTSVAFGVGAGGRPLLASASDDKTVRRWDSTTGAPVATLRRRSPAHSVAFAGEAVVIGDEEGISLVVIDAH